MRILLAFFLSSFLAFAAHAETLVVKVNGAGTQGQVVAGLFSACDGFASFNMAKAAQVKKAPAGNRVILRFEGLAPGRYAVAAFHDEDGNGKVKTNFIGIPREPVGVSNNTGGMPSCAKSLVDVPAAGQIEVNLRKIGS
jgi:uncharacterized protein (DUF2141 family)